MSSDQWVWILVVEGVYVENYVDEGCPVVCGLNEVFVRLIGVIQN